jgi:DNA-binding NarL/FixJ family response regulator
MPSSKILVVDDFKLIRQFVCSALEQRPEFRVVGQAADGLEAIQKAEELQPDLILLDISLPRLDGIAAARQIRKVAPNSKILFLTQSIDREIAEEALSTGASGYLIKSDAGNELFTALDIVIQGGQFVSPRLGQRTCTDVEIGLTASSHPDVDSLKLALQQKRNAGHRHEVHFYSDEAGFVDSFTNFIEASLNAGNPTLVVATASHHSDLYSRLQARGLDIDFAAESGHYIALDAVETLSTFMVDELPDPARFSKAVDDLILRAARTRNGERLRIAACGECSPLLWKQGNAEAAVRLEHLWDEAAKMTDMNILCGYQLADFHGSEGNNILRRICAEHTDVRFL